MSEEMRAMFPLFCFFLGMLVMIGVMVVVPLLFKLRPEDTKRSSDHSTSDNSRAHHLAAREGNRHPPKQGNSTAEGDGPKRTI